MPTKVFRDIFVSELLPDAGTNKQNLVYESIFKNKDIYASIQKQHLQGMRTAADSLFDFGRDEYVFGNPEAQDSSTYSVEGSEVEQVILDIAGEPVTITYYRFETPIEEFFSQEIMARLYSYDELTGIVSSPPFSVPAGAVVTYDNSDFEVDSIDIRYLVTETDTTESFVRHTTAITNFSRFTDYIMLKYNLDSDTSTVLYFLYQISDGTYPTLSEVVSPIDNKEYYPVISLRSGKQTHAEDDADPRPYNDSHTALAYLGINPDTIVEEVMANPDIDEIEDVSLQFMIDIESTDTATNLYLWQHYRGVAELSSSDSYVDYNGNTQWSRFNLRLVCPNFYYNESTALAEETIHVGTKPTEKTIVNSGTVTMGPKYDNITINNVPILTLYRQLTTTTYSKIVVIGVYIYYAAGPDFNNQPRNATIYAEMAAAPGSETYRKMYIPMNRSTLRKCSNNPTIQNEILERGLLLVFNTRSILDIEWYQTPEFGVFVIVLSTIIAVWTLQPELILIAAAETLLIAAGLVLILVLDIYITGLVIKYALDFLVKEFGLEETFWAILAVMIVAIATKSANLLNMSSIAWADKLLAVTLAFISSFSSNIEDSVDKLMDDADAFLLSAEEKQERIDEANSLLGSSGINPFDIVRTEHYFDPNETPNQFFNRTIHNGNPGVLSLNVIESYVDNLLQLPNSSDSRI